MEDEIMRFKNIDEWDEFMKIVDEEIAARGG